MARQVTDKLLSEESFGEAFSKNARNARSQILATCYTSNNNEDGKVLQLVNMI